MSIKPIKKKPIKKKPIKKKPIKKKRLKTETRLTKDTIKRPVIELSVQMFEFQKRFWWMLSSLYEQKSWQGNPIPHIIIKASVMSSADRYSQITQYLTETFNNRLDLRIKEYTSKDLFGYRGFLRTEDLKETKADWMLFTDSDMLFHPEFFSEMSTTYLDKWKASGNLITVPRSSNDRQTACELVNSFDYACKKPIENSFKKGWSIKEDFGRKRTPGAGYFQLVEIDYVRKNNINYCGSLCDANLFKNSGNKYKSDKLFRKNFKGITVMKKAKDKTGSVDVLKPIIHLNHWRSGDEQWAENKGN